MPIEIKVGGAPPAAAALSALGAEPARVSRMPRRLQRRTKAHRFAEAVSSSTRSFVRCVTMRESSMEWHIVDPPYSGGDQWTESTWLAAGGGRFARVAADASPAQQMLVFERYEPSHPGAWPVTVPACS
ncbi:MAG: transglycosylase family protein [Solirubrobacteraceae bacterium]